LSFELCDWVHFVAVTKKIGRHPEYSCLIYILNVPK
jgi:hypothetical protein